MIVLLLDVIAVSCAALLCLQSLVRRRKGRAAKAHPYPPGPKPLPLIGNILDMPTSDEWEKAVEWGQQYGEVLIESRVHVINHFHSQVT